MCAPPTFWHLPTPLLNSSTSSRVADFRLAVAKIQMQYNWENTVKGITTTFIKSYDILLFTANTSPKSLVSLFYWFSSSRDHRTHAHIIRLTNTKYNCKIYWPLFLRFGTKIIPFESNNSKTRQHILAKFQSPQILCLK